MHEEIGNAYLHVYDLYVKVGYRVRYVLWQSVCFYLWPARLGGARSGGGGGGGGGGDNRLVQAGWVSPLKINFFFIAGY